MSLIPGFQSKEESGDVEGVVPYGLGRTLRNRNDEEEKPVDCCS